MLLLLLLLRNRSRSLLLLTDRVSSLGSRLASLLRLVALCLVLLLSLSLNVLDLVRTVRSLHGLLQLSVLSENPVLHYGNARILRISESSYLISDFRALF